MLKPVKRWWRRHFIKPAIQPDSLQEWIDEKTAEDQEMLDRYGATDMDQLWETALAQAPNYSNASTGAKDGLDSVPSGYWVPMRDGKPATIYVHENHEFETADEAHQIIRDIRHKHKRQMQKEIAGIKAVIDQLP